MTCSLLDSALFDFVKEVDGMEPDFSCKPRQLPTDTVVGDAPEYMGKFLARKRLLNSQEQYLLDDELKENRAMQSLCDQHASREFKKAFGRLPNFKRLVVRRNGKVVEPAA